jgi:putative exosortase-associated protein (TIGR04073 family)
MRNALSLLGLLAIAVTLTSGCAGPEQKLGRGIRNTSEVIRLGELRYSMEQTGVWDSPADACTTGVIIGVDRSVARTGIGLYEIITYPFPPYHPVCTKYLPPEPVYPDNYHPALAADPLYDSDQYIGFSSGRSFGFIPGSQFSVFGD